MSRNLLLLFAPLLLLSGCNGHAPKFDDLRGKIENQEEYAVCVRSSDVSGLIPDGVVVFGDNNLPLKRKRANSATPGVKYSQSFLFLFSQQAINLSYDVRSFYSTNKSDLERLKATLRIPYIDCSIISQKGIKVLPPTAYFNYSEAVQSDRAVETSADLSDIYPDWVSRAGVFELTLEPTADVQ